MECLINIDVPDIERAIAFYRDAVGLHLARRLFNGSVAEMLGAAAPIYLLCHAVDSAPCAHAPAMRDYARHWTPVHIDFVVDDLDAAVERALRAGAQLEKGPLNLAWGRLAVLSDPFGHGLCFIQWVGEAYVAVECHADHR